MIALYKSTETGKMVFSGVDAGVRDVAPTSTAASGNYDASRVFLMEVYARKLRERVRTAGQP